MVCQAFAGVDAVPRVRYASALLRVVELSRFSGANAKSAAAGRDEDADSDKSLPSALHFPEDRAMGVVSTRPLRAGGWGFRGNWYDDWKQVGEARGEVLIPPRLHRRCERFRLLS